MSRNPFITRSSYRDDWNLTTRITKQIHKDYQNEYFDDLPKVEGLGRPLNDYAYSTRALDRFYRSHIGKPWTQVQKKLKERLPDPHEYDIAAREVQTLIEGKDGELLLNSSKWWGTRMQPLSEGARYSPFFYVDLNGFLREQQKAKYVPRPPTIQKVESGGYYWFKRKGLVFKAPIPSVRYESSYKAWTRFRPKSYDAYGDVIFYDSSKSSWMRIKASDIRQASKKDIERNNDSIKLISDNLTVGTPELDR